MLATYISLCIVAILTQDVLLENQLYLKVNHPIKQKGILEIKYNTGTNTKSIS